VAGGLAPAWADSPVQLNELDVTASRLSPDLVGTATTIIDSDRIRNSTALTIPQILSEEAGIQVRSLYNNAGTQATVDMRGFGATGSQNTLILLDGRRLNDVDLSAVDLDNIPLDSIDHIEVTRGNSGGVLYGDGAEGGVINIVTKAAGSGAHGSVTATHGTDGYWGGDASYGQTVGAFSASAYANWIHNHGYRDNNRLIQRNLVGDLRYRPEGAGELYLRFNVDSQKLGLPGGRTVNPVLGIDDLHDHRRGADTPTDKANQTGFNVATGGKWELTPDITLVLDSGVRQKDQNARYFGGFDYVDTTLTTWSLTPRVLIDHRLAGRDANTIAGIDYYYSNYDSDRSRLAANSSPIHRYNGHQNSAAAYSLTTVHVTSDLDVAAGGRAQYVGFRANDRFNPAAPGATPPFDFGRDPVHSGKVQWAAHLGADLALGHGISAFGRVARSFRLPTVDERVGSAGTKLDLSTQTSHDIEAGLRYAAGGFSFQSSAFLMWLRDEIAFDPVNFVNYNLDDTRRWGVENTAEAQVARDLRLRGALTYTNARFTAGPDKGNEVPLVSRWTASVGAQWQIRPWVALSTTIRYVGARRMDNDSANTAARISDHTIADLRLSGRYRQFNWALTVSDLFNKSYFEYAAASTFTPGAFSAYPLPRRTVMFQVGMTF
jgi:iron complex outermembrane receptor protein